MSTQGGHSRVALSSFLEQSCGWVFGTVSLNPLSINHTLERTPGDIPSVKLFLLLVLCMFFVCTNKHLHKHRSVHQAVTQNYMHSSSSYRPNTHSYRGFTEALTHHYTELHAAQLHYISLPLLSPTTAH
eukprot:9472-Heterococcus_DN1.PRE.2